MNNKGAPVSPKKAKRPKKDKGDAEDKRKKFKDTHDGHIEENCHHIEAEPVASEATWTDGETKQLISRIEGSLPKIDTLSFKKRLSNINWEDVKFEQFSSEQCRTQFLSVLSKQRKYRTLTEILEDAKKWVDVPRKKVAHPDMPSKPLTSYLIYFLDHRPKLAKKYPGMKMTELTQKIAEKFKKLPPEKKQKYIDKAESQKEEYVKQLKIFYEQHPDQIAPEASGKKKANSAGLFRPQPPFKNYYDKKLKEHENEENFDQKAFASRCREKWNRMSDKKKFVWIKWTMEKEDEYMEQMKIFQAKCPDQCTLSDFKSVLSKDEKSLYNKMCGKPDKPPKTAYILFSRDFLKSSSNGTNQREKMKECSEKWKMMTNIEKSEYSDRLKQLQQKYEQQYADYLSKLPEDKRLAELEEEKAKIKQKVAITSKKAETMCNALENFIQRSDKVITTINENKFKNEPIEPPKTVREYFIQKYTRENSGPGGSVTTTQAKSAWKGVSEKKKIKYRKELTALKGKYIREYEAFLKSLNEQELEEYSMNKARHNTKSLEDEETSSGDSDDDDDSSKETDSEEEEEEEEEEKDTKELKNEPSVDSESDSSSD